MSRYKEKNGNIHKSENNRRFVELVARHIATRPRLRQRRQRRLVTALVLDSASMLSSNALAGVIDASSIKSIDVPQIDPCTRLLRAMHRNAPRRARIVPGSLAQLLRNRKTRTPFNAVYADYMNNVTGNRATGCLPLQDMSDLLELHMDRTGNVVLCCTFAARLSGKGLFADRTSAQDQIIQDYLRPLWALHRFKVVELSGRTYKRDSASMAMVFVSAVLRHDPCLPGPNSREAVFVCTDTGHHFDGYS
jgi:hypothetical protein